MKIFKKLCNFREIALIDLFLKAKTNIKSRSCNYLYLCALFFILKALLMMIVFIHFSGLCFCPIFRCCQSSSSSLFIFFFILSGLFWPWHGEKNFHLSELLSTRKDGLFRQHKYKLPKWTSWQFDYEWILCHSHWLITSFSIKKKKNYGDFALIKFLIVEHFFDVLYLAFGK